MHTQSRWQFGLTWNDPENNEGMLTERGRVSVHISSHYQAQFVKACS